MSKLINHYCDCPVGKCLGIDSRKCCVFRYTELKTRELEQQVAERIEEIERLNRLNKKLTLRLNQSYTAMGG